MGSKPIKLKLLRPYFQTPFSLYHPSLFDVPIEQKETDQKLMQQLDTLNTKHGKTLWFASQGTNQEWGMKRELLSPAYTTNWQELPVVR